MPFSVMLPLPVGFRSLPGRRFPTIDDIIGAALAVHDNTAAAGIDSHAATGAGFIQFNTIDGRRRRADGIAGAGDDAGRVGLVAAEGDIAAAGSDIEVITIDGREIDRSACSAPVLASMIRLKEVPLALVIEVLPPDASKFIVAFGAKVTLPPSLVMAIPEEWKLMPFAVPVPVVPVSVIGALPVGAMVIACRYMPELLVLPVLPPPIPVRLIRPVFPVMVPPR